jgi:membrane-bound ClpP family serine protease
MFVFPVKNWKQESQKLILKQKVIQQNMTILQSKLTKTHFSYTKIVKGYSFFEQGFLGFLHFLKQPIFSFILLYIGSFLIFINAKYYGIISFDVNFNGIFYLLLLLFSYTFLHFTK